MAKKSAVAAGGDDELGVLRRKVAEKKKLLKELEELDAREIELLGDDAPAGKDAKLPGQERADKILAELKGSGSFVVNRIEQGKQVKIGTYDLDLWPEAMESVVKQKGGGDYIVNFHNGDGEFAGRVGRTYDATTYGTGTAAPPGAFDPMQFFSILERRDEASRREVEAARAAADKSRDEMMKIMLETMKSAAGAGGGFIKNLGDVQAVAKMFQGDSRSLLDQIDELEEARDRLRGGVRAEEENPLLAVVGRVLDALPKALQIRPALPPAAPASAAALPAAPAPAPAPAAPKKLSLAAYVPNFRLAIESGTAADEAAVVAWGACSTPEDRAGLKALAELGDWDSLEADAYLKEHRAWISGFRKRLTEILANPPAPIEPPVAPTPAPIAAAAAAEPGPAGPEASEAATP